MAEWSTALTHGKKFTKFYREWAKNPKKFAKLELLSPHVEKFVDHLAKYDVDVHYTLTLVRCRVEFARVYPSPTSWASRFQFMMASGFHAFVESWPDDAIALDSWLRTAIFQKVFSCSPICGRVFSCP